MMARLHFLLFLRLASCLRAELKPRQTASIPDFVNTYAPLVYLDQNELYLPSDLQAQLNNTFPAVNFTAASNIPYPLTLSDLSSLNAIGSCGSFSDCDVFLTSKVDPTKNPQYLYGVLPDANGTTSGATSCAIIVNDHGDGTVDAFYMFFYAFNLGLEVLGGIQDDHVGDWEHVMIRFANGKPSAMWFSQHDAGQVFSWDALSKNGSRPVVYSAIGSHANFAVNGTQTRVIAGLSVNDYTSPGPVWDPVKSAYYYTYSPSSETTLTNGNGTFVGVDNAPVPWLYYLGAWGDKQYPDSDPRQVDLYNVSWKWMSGPTGPLDKVLNRSGVCPSVNCTTLTVLPTASGSTIPVTVTRTSSSTSSGATSGGSSTTSSSIGVKTTSSTAGARLERAMETGIAIAGFGLLAAML